MRYIRLTAVLLLLACGDGGTTPTSPPTPPSPPTPVATSITLSATSLSFSSLGATQQLTATVKDQNGATMSGTTVDVGYLVRIRCYGLFFRSSNFSSKRNGHGHGHIWISQRHCSRDCCSSCCQYRLV